MSELTFGPDNDSLGQVQSVEIGIRERRLKKLGEL